MEALLKFRVDLSRVAVALERIAIAVERISPPIETQPIPDRAGLSDLRSTDPQKVTPINEALSHFAEEHRVMPNSEAFIASIMQYEDRITDVYGPEAPLELPWNKAA